MINLISANRITKLFVTPNSLHIKIDLNSANRITI